MGFERSALVLSVALAGLLAPAQADPTPTTSADPTADVAIMVNVGTPPGGRETLNSALGLTSQMINLLTEQNVQRSLATLGPHDVLIAPALGTLTASDFDQTGRFFALGEAGARGRSDKLAALALDAPTYAAWRAGHPNTRRCQHPVGQRDDSRHPAHQPRAPADDAGEQAR